MPLITEPKEFFELCFDGEFRDYITTMLNLYASHDKENSFFQTSPIELQCWFEILLFTGYLQLPKWRCMCKYLSKYYFPSVAKAMRRNRLEKLKALAHFSNNSKLDIKHRFSKVRPLFCMLNKQVLQLAVLEKLMYEQKHGLLLRKACRK